MTGGGGEGSNILRSDKERYSPLYASFISPSREGCGRQPLEQSDGEARPEEILLRSRYAWEDSVIVEKGQLRKVISLIEGIGRRATFIDQWNTYQ